LKKNEHPCIFSVNLLEPCIEIWDLKNYFKEISFQFWQFFSKELIEFVRKKFQIFATGQHSAQKRKKERKKEISK
jgi:hypothetical protein